MSVNDLELLKEKLDLINEMTLNDLHEHYNKVLLDMDTVDEVKTGLGLIDIRIKSEKKIKYSFKEISEEIVFFTLQTAIEDKA